MEAQKHKIVSSELIYKYNLFEIILHISESIMWEDVFFCFTRRNFKSNEVKSNKSSNEYNFFWPVDVASKLLQEIPGAIDFVRTLPNKCSYNDKAVDRILRLEFPKESSINTKEGCYKVVT